MITRHGAYCRPLISGAAWADHARLTLVDDAAQVSLENTQCPDDHRSTMVENYHTTAGAHPPWLTMRRRSLRNWPGVCASSQYSENMS